MSKEMTRLVVVRSLILVALVLVGWLFVVSPRLGGSESLAAQIADANTQAAMLEAEAADPSKTEAELKQAMEVFNTLQTRYPETTESTQLTDVVLSAAGQAGIEPGNVAPLTLSDPVLGGSEAATSGASDNPSPAAADNPSTAPQKTGLAAVKYATVEVKFAVTGPLSSIQKFLDLLPKQQRLLYVKSVSIQPAEDGLTGYTASITCTSLLLDALTPPAGSDSANADDSGTNPATSPSGSPSASASASSPVTPSASAAG